MAALGVTPVPWSMAASALRRDWRLPTGLAMAWLFHEHNPDCSLLMGNYHVHTKQAAAK